MGRVIDLGSGDEPDELRVVLDCRGCGTASSPVRRGGDSKSVVRCRECGKKHHLDSLEVR